MTCKLTLQFIKLHLIVAPNICVCVCVWGRGIFSFPHFQFTITNEEEEENLFWDDVMKLLMMRLHHGTICPFDLPLVRIGMLVISPPLLQVQLRRTPLGIVPDTSQSIWPCTKNYA